MAIKRQVFYSFHYQMDNWRASQIRNIGAIEGNKPASDNHWEKIKKGGKTAIKRWINNQMQDRSCTIVLVGRDTANRKWINYEIIKSWRSNMGVVGIYIYGLKNKKSYISKKGENPFNYISYENNETLSNIVKCYNPRGDNSRERYEWISRYLSKIVEEAIKIRKKIIIKNYIKDIRLKK